MQNQLGSSMLGQNTEPVIVVLLIIAVGLLIILTGITLIIGKPWLQCFLSGAKVSLFEILGMWLRRSNLNLILGAHISFVQQGKPQNIKDLESCFIANRHQIDDVHPFMRKFEASKFFRDKTGNEHSKR